MEDEKQESLLGAYRILDLTDEKGLFCGKVLADFGADVIKIEKPDGDEARNIGPFYKDQVHKEKSLNWFYYNLNKRGITLDIEKKDGKEIFERLVHTSDFVIESFDPGYMAGLGLGYEDLEKLNPRIIMTSITPFGQTGPRKDFKHSDISTWAMGGMMNLSGDSDRAPVRAIPQTRLQGGLHAALGTMLAHYFRETTGEGQHVDVSIQQACMLSMMTASECWDVLKVNIPRFGSSLSFPRGDRPPLLFPNISPCKDGYVTFMLMLGASPLNVKSNRAVVDMMDEDGVAGDLKSFDWASTSAETVPQEEYDTFRKPIDNWLLTKTKSELFKGALERSILLAPVSNIKDLAENPHLRARDFWAEVDHPELEDKITYPGAPAKLSECPWQVKRRPPLIGEHNEEIYHDELGFTKQHLALLKASGVI